MSPVVALLQKRRQTVKGLLDERTSAQHEGCDLFPRRPRSRIANHLGRLESSLGRTQEAFSRTRRDGFSSGAPSRLCPRADENKPRASQGAGQLSARLLAIATRPILRSMPSKIR